MSTFLFQYSSHQNRPVTTVLEERALRIEALVEKPRCMTVRAATTVVDAAMFGIGCIEGEVRRKIQEKIDAENNSQ